MSLFDDDFYPSSSRGGFLRESKWRGSGGSFQRGRRQLMGLVLMSAVVGAVLALLMLPFLVSQGIVTVDLSNGKIVAPALSYSLDPHRKQSDLVVDAAAAVRPAVVSVVSSSRGDSELSPIYSRGIGSGVIIEKKGNRAKVITNQHVIESGPFIEVILADGQRKTAVVIGKDRLTDLAVLEIDASGIQAVAELGDSDALRVGETAIAIGNPLGLGFSQTVTVGVISSPQRTIPISLNQDGNYDWEMHVIQTDAAINQGNSGGALVNLEGKVIGINSRKVSETGVEGLGFAIPSNLVKPIVESLIEHGKVRRPALGVYLQDLQSYLGRGAESLGLPEHVRQGIIVLEAQGAAKEAGLLEGDVIVELDGHAVGSTLALRRYLYNEKGVGETIIVTYYRKDKKHTVSFPLGELSE